MKIPYNTSTTRSKIFKYVCKIVFYSLPPSIHYKTLKIFNVHQVKRKGLGPVWSNKLFKFSTLGKIVTPSSLADFCPLCSFSRFMFFSCPCNELSLVLHVSYNYDLFPVPWLHRCLPPRNFRLSSRQCTSLFSFFSIILDIRIHIRKLYPNDN